MIERPISDIKNKAGARQGMFLVASIVGDECGSVGVIRAGDRRMENAKNQDKELACLGSVF